MDDVPVNAFSFAFLRKGIPPLAHPHSYPDLCIPVLPNTYHPSGYEPLRLLNLHPLPWDGCYISATDELGFRKLRVTTTVRDYTPILPLEPEELWRVKKAVWGKSSDPHGTPPPEDTTPPVLDLDENDIESGSNERNDLRIAPMYDCGFFGVRYVEITVFDPSTRTSVSNRRPAMSIVYAHPASSPLVMLNSSFTKRRMLRILLCQ